MSEIRLQKFLADSGVTSRRKAEDLIGEGRVRVNGKVVSRLGSKINPIKHKVTIDNQPIIAKTTKLYIAFYKPRGVLSTMLDDRGRPCIGDYFNELEERLFHVGRLDKESEGLLLLTNDGGWANEVAHPSKGVEKSYRVIVEELVTRQHLAKLTKGIRLEDGLAKASLAKQIPGGFEITLHEGRNQIVRRMAAALGLSIIGLKRVRIGRIHLGELKSGKWRYLSSVETINT
jgi:pseudouridine synthase